MPVEYNLTDTEANQGEGSTMYGLLLQSIYDYLRTRYGEQTFERIRVKANIPHHSFATHQVYSETVIPRLAAAARDVTGTPYDDVMEGLGQSFVNYMSQYGYDKLLQVLGRNLRDFLNGLDNLHEYIKFSYPKIHAPSFFCDCESASGVTLHYRTKRKGFVHYVIGQIKEVAKLFYNQEVKVEVLRVQEFETTIHVAYQLYFDNSDFMEDQQLNSVHTETNLQINSDIFFDVFPFNIVFDKDMIIANTGAGLNAVMSDLRGTQIDDAFTIVRPLVDLSWSNIVMHTNTQFELATLDPVKKLRVQEEIFGEDIFRPHQTAPSDIMSAHESSEADEGECLHLKGQMMYIEEWNCMVFLGTPVMANLEMMFKVGLYINDLSMHDSSRDLVLAGTQQSAELKLALDQEQKKSRTLEDSMRKLDLEMKRTDTLLYQMIPKTVADRLRKGEPAMNTCEVFNSVTILFSDVKGFTTICSKITPMQVVSMLNNMYTVFDTLTEKHGVYKVETIGDAYMVVSGAPIVDNNHALSIAEMAFDMLSSMPGLKDPSTGGHMKIRVGLHSGTVVAGVVGLKMPRYCLFGDTVNTASRMESNGEAMKVHVSETTKELLRGFPYEVEERGTIEVKGKGSLITYWLSRSENASEKKETATVRPFPRSSVGPSHQAPTYNPVIVNEMKGDLAPISEITSVQTSQSNISNAVADGNNSVIAQNRDSESTTPKRPNSSPKRQTSGKSKSGLCQIL